MLNQMRAHSNARIPEMQRLGVDPVMNAPKIVQQICNSRRAGNDVFGPDNLLCRNARVHRVDVYRRGQ